MKRLLVSVTAALALALPAYSKCPAAPGVTVVLRAISGSLNVETTGTDSVEAEVNTTDIQIKETCGKDRIEITSTAAAPIRSAAIWKITTPKAVHLDLVTQGGNIRVMDTDGDAVLRTTGGSVTAGNVRGRAAIVTQGGSIKTGNIGGNAELRSQLTIEAGNIGGDADLETAGGAITAGIVSGKASAQTAGGSISLLEARGDVVANTDAGDISVGNAGRVEARTKGGNITSNVVRGPFKGQTDAGDIRIDSARGWVEASTGFGNIFLRLAPETLDGDFHVNLQTGVGDLTIHLPEKLRATIDATVDKAPPSQSATRISSDFGVTQAPVAGLVTNRFFSGIRSQSVMNGGGNKIQLHTSLGKITIKKN